MSSSGSGASTKAKNILTVALVGAAAVYAYSIFEKLKDLTADQIAQTAIDTAKATATATAQVAVSVGKQLLNSLTTFTEHLLFDIIAPVTYSAPDDIYSNIYQYQPGWRRCSKCSQLFYNSILSSPLSCPHDLKPHTPFNSRYYFLPRANSSNGVIQSVILKPQGVYVQLDDNGNPIRDASGNYVIGPPRDTHFRWCKRCSSLVQGNTKADLTNHCFDRLDHDVSASEIYYVDDTYLTPPSGGQPEDSTDDSRQLQWGWKKCIKCSTVVWPYLIPDTLSLLDATNKVKQLSTDLKTQQDTLTSIINDTNATYDQLKKQTELVNATINAAKSANTAIANSAISESASTDASPNPINYYCSVTRGAHVTTLTSSGDQKSHVIRLPWSNSDKFTPIFNTIAQSTQERYHNQTQLTPEEKKSQQVTLDIGAFHRCQAANPGHPELCVYGGSSGPQYFGTDSSTSSSSTSSTSSSSSIASPTLVHNGITIPAIYEGNILVPARINAKGIRISDIYAIKRDSNDFPLLDSKGNIIFDDL